MKFFDTVFYTFIPIRYASSYAEVFFISPACQAPTPYIMPASFEPDRQSSVKPQKDSIVRFILDTSVSAAVTIK